MLKTALAMEHQTLAELSYSLDKHMVGKYDSQLSIVFKERQIMDWSARIVRTESKIDGSSTLSGIFLETPMTGQVSLTFNADERWNVEGELDTQWLNAHLNGYFQQSDTSFNVKVKFDIK